jgi:glycosyltransferase involved in cell wall biosynthesis
VLIAAHEHDAELRECLDSLSHSTRASVPLLRVPPSTSEVNNALAVLAPADVVLLTQPCRVTPGWLERLRDVARSDTNIATISALVDSGGGLALGDAQDQPVEDLAKLAGALATNTLALHPRLSRTVGPCVYVRREALELVGLLDEQLDLHVALELDFAQRCVLAGLTHAAGDDVLVGRLSPAPATAQADEQPPAAVLERYPYLAGSSGRAGASAQLADSAVLARALAAARGPRARLDVTFDARALDGAITGTQVHVLELICALARTEALSLRVLVREQRIDHDTLELLRGLPATEILAAEDLDPATPKSAVFHRPQQTFSASDVALAVSLGERIVLSQLDLIAYRNPGYFADADAWEDYRCASRHGLSAAERVVVFSDHTRRELLDDALVEDTRIRVVPPGLDHHVTAETRRPAALDGARGEALADGFLLCLGTDFRHKNRVFALRLLGALRDDHGWEGSLVLAGTHIALGSSLEIEDELLSERPELRDAVVAIGPVSEQEKAWLMARAGAIVYPSAYEGFGLVPFESALSDVPCVFAPQSSLAEAAPEGTATIVPWDAQASAAAAYALLTDPRARSRQVSSLAAAARELTWTASATALVAIYREAALAPVRDAATLSRDAVRREGRLSVEHDIEAAQLVREREHAQRMYGELNAEVGSGLSLIGPHGALPEDVQRALLTLTARPQLSRPLFNAVSRVFRLARACSRALRGARRTGS